MTTLHVRALEINAVRHCNVSCIGCSHASPAATPQNALPEVVSRDLVALAIVLSVDLVRIVGGEPLLHPQLYDLLAVVRESGIGKAVRLVTNGTLLHRRSLDWLELVDEVHVSKYPGVKIDAAMLDELSRRCRCGNKRLIIKDYANFRMVDPARPLTLDEQFDVFETCQLAHEWSCHTVEDGRVYLCPPSMPPYRQVVPADRCEIDPPRGLADRLSKLLSRTAPLEACSTCLGSVGNLASHRQGNRKTWLSLSHSGIIDREHLQRLRTNQDPRSGMFTEHRIVDPP